VTPESALLLAVVAVFGAVALGVGIVTSRVLSQATPERRRLRQATKAPATGVLIDAPTLTPAETGFVKQMSAMVPRSPKDMTSLRRRFARAGYYELTPIAVYTLVQLIAPIVFGLLPLFLFSFTGTGKWVAVLIGAGLGYQLPGLWLARKTSQRQKQLQNGLPDLLDLLIVCLEAGSALDQAIVKASDELELAYPALAEEFRLLVTEVRAGKPRLEAFRNLASRTGVEDIRSLVAMLVQTDRFGTSVAQALRTHAEVARTKRRQRAEEKAAKLGVKLVFPLVFMLFPAFFVVTLGPAVIQFIRVFFGQVAGR
jgi:tight adherence protein C